MAEITAKAQQDPVGCRLFVGTSGYSYTEWVDAGFYPPGTKSGRMLPLYAQHFSITELNYTWYQMPRSEVIERQRGQAPKTFLFAAKLTRSLTHEIDQEHWPDHAARYRDGMTPLVQAGQLAAVLIQLPHSFHRTSPNRKYLAMLLDALHGLPLAIEFRHRSWANDRVFAELERRGITLVGVDGPDLPGLFPVLNVVTNPDLFYVRFHGRNAKGWYSGNMQRQFDYNYSDDELREWIEDKIETMNARARRGVLFFNNHVLAQAPANALRMADLLKEHGLTVV
jgi:uncharacterized protein YecE (DUF72 family)